MVCLLLVFGSMRGDLCTSALRVLTQRRQDRCSDNTTGHDAETGNSATQKTIKPSPLTTRGIRKRNYSIHFTLFAIMIISRLPYAISFTLLLLVAAVIPRQGPRGAVPKSSLKVESIMRQQRTIEKTRENTLHPRFATQDTSQYLNKTDVEIEEELELQIDHAALNGHGISAASATGFDPTAQAQEPFPKWLSDFTQMTAWPGLDPPYIPLDFLPVHEIPPISPYQQGICPGTRDSCSFDCFKCVEPDDAYTCPKLSQTFDDGPSPATTKLISHLSHKTTFFTLGVNVVRYPDVYRQVKDKGHLLGSHTWSHKFLPSLTNEEIIAQIEWSIWAMNATGHHLPKWFRPPYGGYDNRVRYILRKFGMQAALWDYDTFDWQILNNDKTENQVISDVVGWKNSSPNPTGLILEHDGALETVNCGIKVNDVIGEDQWTVAQCMGAIEYIRVFDQ